MRMFKLTIAALLALQSAWALAHPPGLSSLEIDLGGRQLVAKITFALQDIEAFAPMDSDLDAEVTDAEREAAKPAIAVLLADQLKMQADGRLLEAMAGRSVVFDEQNNAQVLLHYPLAGERQLRLQSDFLQSLPAGHQQYLTVRDESGRIVAEKMLDNRDDGFQLDLTDAMDGEQARSSTFADFFALGIEHIVTGYDHLLFLLALLAVTQRFGAALKIITSFTLAHSITLACAGLGIVALPSNVVEPLIAATIVYVGMENIVLGGQPKGRHWLTFGFGLIHGFGFAGVLQEMGISSANGGVLLPLLSFNLGIECGQIAITALVLPCIWWLNRQARLAESFMRGCSVSVCLMGGFWLLERTLL